MTQQKHTSLEEIGKELDELATANQEAWQPSVRMDGVREDVSRAWGTGYWNGIEFAKEFLAKAHSLGRAEGMKEMLATMMLEKIDCGKPHSPSNCTDCGFNEAVDESQARGEEKLKGEWV